MIIRRLTTQLAVLIAITSTKTAMADLYSDAVLADNPVAYYRLEETAGSTASNSGTATGIDATYANIGDAGGPNSIGRAGPRPGDSAGAYVIEGFDITNRSIHLTPVIGSSMEEDDFPRVEVADAEGGPLAINGGLTLEAWIRRDPQQVGANNNEGILGRYQGAEYGNERSYLLYYDSDAGGATGGLGVAYSTTGSFESAYSAQTPADIPVGEWNHVAAVVDPSNRMSIYLNGEKIFERLASEGDIPPSLNTGPGDFWIGQQFDSRDIWTFEGNIDEAAVYNQALSDAAIAAHYAAATSNTPVNFKWDNSGSGDWNDAINWTMDTVPNGNTRTAVFGDSTGTSSVVFTDSPVTLKGLRFASDDSFVVSGTGDITLDADAGDAQVQVTVGAHQVQVPVTLNDDTEFNVTSGSIDFNNVMNIGSNAVTILSGEVNLNHSVIADAGGSITSMGTLGTAGLTMFGGDLTSSGNLAIDINGTGTSEFDAFDIDGTATLSGMISPELGEGFELDEGDTFTVLTAQTLIDNGITLEGPLADMMTLNVVGNSLVLQANLPRDGDYNNDGVVNLADYTVWRDSLGSDGAALSNRRSDLLDTTVTVADYEVWKANFGQSNVSSASLAQTAAVPEPSCIVLTLLAAPIWWSVSRRRVGR